MFKQVFTLMAVLFTISLLTGCGGDSSSSSSADSGNGGGGDSSNVRFYAYETGKVVSSKAGRIVLKGLATIDYTGTETFIFKDWGQTRIYKEETDQTITNSDALVQAGRPKTEFKHKKDFTKHVGPIVYGVDYEDQVVEVSDFSALYDLLIKSPNDSKILFSGLTGEISIDGQGSVLGYPCEKQSSATLGVTNCVHEKNISLSSTLISEVGTSTTTAISVEFNIELSESDFALPNYPHEER